jgi:aryl-alcohol dehydrogenase-like predicted oxidoreductase
MSFVRLGRSGVEVSRLCLGTMMFGSITDEAESTRIVHAALDRGILFLDTADVYGSGASEEVVGRAIRDRRDDVVLATKGRQPTGPGPNRSGAGRRHLTRALDASLRRLGTDHVDLYYVHAPDEATPLDETLRTLDDMVRHGKVRYLGCSNFRAWRVCEALLRSAALGLERFACVQPLYNLVNRDVEVELLPLCREQGLGVVTYSPLARGILTAKYVPGAPPPEGSRVARNDKRIREAELRDESLAVAQRIRERAERKGTTASRFALAWCLANPLVTSTIVGPKSLAQFEDNAACLEVEITPEDEAFVDALVPPGEHTGKGFQDPAYPVTGRPRR